MEDIMKKQTNLSNTIDAMDPNKAKYDKNVKEFLSDVQVLARIVKYTVSEVENLSVEEIITCIDGKSVETGAVSVMPGLTNLGKIESLQTEDFIQNEGYVTFDIRFSLIYNGEPFKIIINIEAQKSTNSSKLGYHLENRIIYYLSRLISSQKEKEFFNSEYDNIKKVYSIWICMDTEEGRDSISKISLGAETLYGTPCEFPELDKMCGIVIRIREDDNVVESKNVLIAMLEDMLENESGEVKKRKLEEKYDMKMTTELERKIDDMCNLSTVVEEKGIQKGIQKGIEKGIEKGKLLQLFELVISGDLSAEVAAKKAEMTIEEFTKMMKETMQLA